MKTKELINRVNGVKGIDAYNEDHRVNFYEIGQTFPFYTMAKNNVDFGQGVSNFANLRDTNMSRLSYVIDAIREYLETPLSEREEEKRYWLRLATKIDVYEDRRYLNMDIPNEKYTLSENKDDAYYKAIFTESEITEMDITGFERIEVTP